MVGVGRVDGGKNFVAQGEVGGQASGDVWTDLCAGSSGVDKDRAMADVLVHGVAI